MNSKRIYRAKEEVVLAGVCKGMADYFEVDPVLVRLIWLTLIFFGTMGIPLYLIAWIIIPLKKETTTPEITSVYKRLLRTREDRMIAGICGGLGKYFEKDPVIFRMLAVLLLFSFGIGLWIYLLGILLIPSEA